MKILIIGQAPPAVTQKVPDNNHVFIKSWSENEGMLEALVEAGIVEDLKTNVPTGFVVANYAKVLI